MHGTPSQVIVIYLDATDDPVHGEQEERKYHGYDPRYCLVPLYITRDNQVLAVRVPRL